MKRGATRKVDKEPRYVAAGPTESPIWDLRRQENQELRVAVVARATFSSYYPTEVVHLVSLYTGGSNERRSPTYEAETGVAGSTGKEAQGKPCL